MREQTFDRGGVFRRAGSQTQDVFLSLDVHAHRADDQVLAEALAAAGAEFESISGTRPGCGNTGERVVKPCFWGATDLRINNTDIAKSVVHEVVQKPGV